MKRPKLPKKLTEAQIRLLAIIGMMLAAYITLIVAFKWAGN